MSAQYNICDLSGNTSVNINFKNIQAPDLEAIHQVQYVLPSNWSLFSIPLKLNSIRYGHAALFNSSGQNPLYNPSALVAPDGNYNMDDFMKNHWFEFSEDTVPYWYKDNDGYHENLIIMKNNGGNAYLPEFNFNGIGLINELQGYQIKIKPGKNGTCFKYTGVKQFNEVTNTYNIDYDLDSGWHMICYPNTEPMNAVSFFESFTENNDLIIAKDYLGSAYMPNFNFNGIGLMRPNEGYQLKLQ